MIYSPTHSQSYQTGQLAYAANTTLLISCHQSQWMSHREMGHTGPLSRKGQKKRLILLTTFRSLFLTGKTERAIIQLGQKQKNSKPFQLRKTQTGPCVYTVSHLSFYKSAVSIAQLCKCQLTYLCTTTFCLCLVARSSKQYLCFLGDSNTKWRTIRVIYSYL